MTLSGALAYLEYWHLFLPGSSWLFVGYSLYQQTSYLWEKVTAFLQYPCFGSHPSSQTFIKCLLYALFQLTVWFSLSNLATHSLLLLHSPPHPALLPPRKVASWPGTANQPNKWIRDWTWWGVRGTRGYFRRVLGALGSARIVPFWALLVSVLHPPRAGDCQWSPHFNSSEIYVQIP